MTSVEPNGLDEDSSLSHQRYLMDDTAMQEVPESSETGGTEMQKVPEEPQTVRTETHVKVPDTQEDGQFQFKWV